MKSLNHFLSEKKATLKDIKTSLSNAPEAVHGISPDSIKTFGKSYSGDPGTYTLMVSSYVKDSMVQDWLDYANKILKTNLKIVGKGQKTVYYIG